MSAEYDRPHFAQQVEYARRWGKPRLFLYKGVWWCTGAYYQGIGRTTEEAYSMWTRAVSCH